MLFYAIYTDKLQSGFSLFYNLPIIGDGVDFIKLTLLIRCIKYIINVNKKNFVLKNFTDQPQATPYYGQDYDNITYKLGMSPILHFKFAETHKINFFRRKEQC